MTESDQPDTRAEWGPDRRTVAWVALWLALAVAMLRPWIHGADGTRYYAYLRSAVMDGDLDFRNEYEHYAHYTSDLMRFDPETGRLANAVPCGSALLWAPWFLAAHGWAWMTGAATEGYGKPYETAVGLGSAVYGLLGLLMLDQTLRRWFRRRTVGAGVAMVWLASPLVFYMFAHPSMAHANAFFAVCGLLSACAAARRSTAGCRWASVGAWAGLAMVTRFDNLLWVVVPIAIWLDLIGQEWKTSRRMGRLIGLGFLCAGCAVIVFSPQLIAWKSMHGSFFSGPKDFNLGQDLSVWTSPHFGAVLFSARRGVFFWMPLAVVAVVGWLAPSRVPTPFRWAAPVVCFLNAWLVGGWEVWWAGASFGPRFFIACLPLLALGLAAAVEVWPWKRTAAVIGALLIVWNFGLMVQYSLRMVDREDDLTYGQVLSGQARVPVELFRKIQHVIRRSDVAPAPEAEGARE